MKKFSFFATSKFSHKKVFWGLIGVTMFILIYALGILPLVEAKKKAEEKIAINKRVLSKYEEYLSNRKTVEEELDRTVKQHEEAQKRLLPGETPQLGAATLQEIVKRLSEKNGIAIRSFRILEPKESDSYRKVSIQIEFNPTNSMLSLGQFIYDIEHHEKELLVSEMDFLVLNIRIPNQIHGSLVISGLMKGTKTKEKGR
ncbi:MAG: type II secretion system protein GspM [Thermodesulfobacteriota bacterium]